MNKRTNNRNSGCEPRALRHNCLLFSFSISNRATQIQQYIIYIYYIFIIIHALESQHDIAIN